MTGADVAFVVRSQMKVFATADAYTTDYYAHRYTARGTNSTLVAPAWTEQKAMIRDREDHLRRDQREVTEKWEQGNKVLGHVEKSDVARPRHLLGTTLTSSKKPFTSALWKARGAIDAGLVALLDYEEARDLAKATPHAAARATQDAARHVVRASCAVFGRAPHPSDLRALFAEGGERRRLSGEDASDVALLAALVALPKGVKLLARCARAVPATAACSDLVAEALQALDSRDSKTNAFADLDADLVRALLDCVLPLAPLRVLVDAAQTYAEAAATNKDKRDDAPASVLAAALLAHGDQAAAHADDDSEWRQARDDLLSLG